jgi:hypothetical protein
MSDLKLLAAHTFRANNQESKIEIKLIPYFVNKILE